MGKLLKKIIAVTLCFQLAFYGVISAFGQSVNNFNRADDYIPSVEPVIPYTQYFWDKSSDKSLANYSAKVLTVPSALGGWGNVFFDGMGITYPASYTTKFDATYSLGAGLFNPFKSIGIQLTFNSLNTNHLFDPERFSSNFKIHRYLVKGIAVAVGGENVLRSKRVWGGNNYYFVVTKINQTDAPSFFERRVSVTVGGGTGRFSKKSSMDISTDKGERGTSVFGAFSFELLMPANFKLFPSANIIAEWNGVNVGAGISVTLLREKMPININIGATDFTGNSGSGVRLFSSVSLTTDFR